MDASKNDIDVCFSPALYPLQEQKDSIVVVIDVLRATSAICTAFHHGASKMIPIATVEEAWEYKKKGFMVGAERDAIPVEGFDFGNSPYSYMGECVKGQTIVITTTNGTQAIEAAKNAYKVVIGAFVNISALCSYLEKENRNVVLLCSGWKNKFNLEDTLFAGAVVSKLTAHNAFKASSDAALAAKFLYENAKENPITFLRNASHKERLAKLNLKNDIKYCLQFDVTTKIPVLKNGVLSCD